MGAERWVRIKILQCEPLFHNTRSSGQPSISSLLEDCERVVAHLPQFQAVRPFNSVPRMSSHSRHRCLAPWR